MTRCPRPLDPIDAEAVAAGAPPVFAADAAAHAAECPSCGELVASGERLSRSLEASLEGLSGASAALSGLPERVARLRAFSRRERRTYALWQAPLLLDLALGLAGMTLLALPVLTGTEQISIGAAALAPLAALAQSTLAWLLEAMRVAPAGLEALSESLRRESALGLAALAVLIPAALGLRRVLARAPGRR